MSITNKHTLLPGCNLTHFLIDWLKMLDYENDTVVIPILQQAIRHAVSLFWMNWKM